MTAIEEIRARFERKHPILNFVVQGNSLTVPAFHENGFDVILLESDRDWMVSYDGWHEHFDNKEDALGCFGFAFSEKCRLKVFLCGDSPYKWTVETIENGNWTEMSTTGLIPFTFWRRKKVVYKQNSLPNGI